MSPTPSQSEVRQAIKSLTDTQLDRLYSYAQFKMLGLRGRVNHSDAGDLMREAVVCTLNGDTPWKTRFPIFIHLIYTMDSIARTWLREANKYADEQGERHDKGRQAANNDAIAMLEEFLKHLKGDDVALAILHERVEGWTAHEVQARLKIKPQVYDAAMKRVSRLRERLFPKEVRK